MSYFGIPIRNGLPIGLGSVAPLASGGGSPFSPLSLFSGGAPGAWYDPSDLTTLFQDSAGTTPVTAMEQPVGLMLDKSQGLVASTKGAFFPRTNNSTLTTPAAATSLAFSGDFTLETQINLANHPAATAAEFITKGAASTYDYRFYMTGGGSLVLLAFDSGGNQRAYIASSSISIIGGSTTWLKVTLDVDNGAGSSVAKFYQSSDGVAYTQIGTDRTLAVTYTIRNTASSIVVLGADINGTFSQAMFGKMYRAIFKSGVDGPTVADFNPTLYTGGATFTAPTGQVWTINGNANITPDGNHAFQATSASRPVLSARYNLLTKTEQFDDAVWTKNGTTITADSTASPTGAVTADTLVASGTNVNAIFRSYSALIGAGGASTFIYAKAGTKPVIQFGANAALTGTVDARANFDIANGVLGSVDSATLTASIEPAGNGWYLCKVSWTRVGTASANGIWSMQDTTTAAREATSTAGNLFIWGASLVPANQSTLPYQRVNTATDYNTTGFLPYLKFDGVDDSLSTNSISFTSTDKMSVFAGVRKLVDSDVKSIVDFGASGSSTAGGFSMWAGNPTSGGSPVWAASFQSSAGGGVFNVISPTTFPAPDTAVCMAYLDVVNPGSYLRVDGVLQATSAADPPNGTFGNLPLRLSRTGANGLNGQIYSMIIVGKAVTAGELSSTETYVNQKTGAY